MKYGLSGAVILAIVFIFSGYGAGFAEDAYAPSSETQAVPGATVSEAPSAAVPEAVTAAAAEITPTSAQDPDVLWLWGEVVSVDAQKNELTVKYLDYESDSEKEIIITVNDKTGYEGIKSLDELRAVDTVSVDYVVVDGKSMARNISVEKPENVEPAKDDAGSVAVPDAQEVFPDAGADTVVPQLVPDSNPPATE